MSQHRLALENSHALPYVFVGKSFLARDSRDGVVNDIVLVDGVSLSGGGGIRP